MMAVSTHLLSSFFKLSEFLNDSFDYLITLSHKTFEKQPSHFYCLVVKIHNTQYTHTL